MSVSNGFETPWTVAQPARLLCPWDLPDENTGVFLGYWSIPGIEPMSPALAGRFFTTKPPGKPQEAITPKFKGERELMVIKWGRLAG